MAEYLLSVHMIEGTDYGPDGTGGYSDEEEMERAFAQTDAFNQKLRDSGQWVFAGGLQAPDIATVVDATGSQTTITDGPYSEAKEHIGGFWIIDVPDLDTALALATEASAACIGAVEVRPFQQGPEA